MCGPLGLHKLGITIHSLDGSQSSIGLPSGSLSHAKIPMEGYSSVFSIATPLLLRWLRTSRHVLHRVINLARSRLIFDVLISGHNRPRYRSLDLRVCKIPIFERCID